MSARAALRVAMSAVLLLLPDGGVSFAQVHGAPDRPAREHGDAGHPHPDGANRAPEQDRHPAGDPAGDPPPYPPGVPPVTPEDRAAAFPPLDDRHTVHDNAVHSYVAFDEVEWLAGGGGDRVSWDNEGWVGRDLNRFWFRTEGAGGADGLDAARVHALYGRAIARWWDLVVGLRQDIGPGPDTTWAAVGIQGLAPYWFEVEATAYVGGFGRTHVRLESAYELLLTNRLVLRPLVEVDLYGKADPERGTGAGLGSTGLGLRLRYEIRRELAPYGGVVWNRKFFGTADRARAAEEPAGTVKLALGIRVWF